MKRFIHLPLIAILISPHLPAVAATGSPLPPTSNSNLALPNPTFDETAYILDAGDRLRIEVFGVPEYSREYQVLVNGSINLLQASPLTVRGLTLKQAEIAIAQRYRRTVKRASVDITLLAPRPINVAIAGEVSRPGAYRITLGETAQLPTLTQLIQQAGGITQTADPQQVILRRPQANGQTQTLRLNLLDLAQTGNLQQNPILRDGDMVQVIARSQTAPETSTITDIANFATDVSQSLNIAVVGEVNRPGTYIVASSAGVRPTVTQVLQQAGGITQMADIRSITLRRKNNAGQVKNIALDLSKLLEGDVSQDLILQRHDTIVIPTATTLTAAEASKRNSASFAPNEIRITVVGEVVSPGIVAISPNTTLNQALLATGGFNRRAKKKNVELIRLNPNGTMTKQTIAVNLAQGVDEKNNPMLRNNDVILVDRSATAKLSDTLESVLAPIGRLMPFNFLFR